MEVLKSRPVSPPPGSGSSEAAVAHVPVTVTVTVKPLGVSSERAKAGHTDQDTQRFAPASRSVASASLGSSSASGSGLPGLDPFFLENHRLLPDSDPASKTFVNYIQGVQDRLLDAILLPGTDRTPFQVHFMLSADGRPNAAIATYQMFFAPVGVTRLGLPQGVMMASLFIIVTMGIIAVTQGQRKIPVQYAKRVVGQKVYGGQSSFLPLKVNYSGVMPVIFANAILLFPQYLLTTAGAAFNIRFLSDFANDLLRGHPVYYIGMTLLIMFFSYFWVSVMFKPIQIADDLKKYGGYIPGVRPGEPTASFLDFIMTRLTLAGAIFLTVIAVTPDILLFELSVPQRVAAFFGGTGMLITVGVILDTMRQIETFLLQRHYDGFLKKGRIRSRSASPVGAIGNAADLKTVGRLWIVLGSLFLLGIAAWTIKYVQTH